MRKIVIVFGLISGGISSAMMLLTIPFMHQIEQLAQNGELIGYTTIVASFLLVYFGIRAYRDRVGGGSVTFGRAFIVGLLITVISCACYVATWELIYFGVAPDFLDKYAATTIDRARAAGASEQEIEVKTKQLEEFKIQYQNPLFNVGMTFMEPFPVGLIVTLVSAAVLRRSEPSVATRR